MVDIKLDPLFELPASVDGVSYVDYEIQGQQVDDDYEADEFDDEEFDGSDEDSDDSGSDESDASDENLPYPPDYIDIVSQEVRTLKGGGQVVDVTLDLPDPQDGYKYEMRLTKA